MQAVQDIFVSFPSLDLCLIEFSLLISSRKTRIAINPKPLMSPPSPTYLFTSTKLDTTRHYHPPLHRYFSPESPLLPFATVLKTKKSQQRESKWWGRAGGVKWSLVNLHARGFTFLRMPLLALSKLWPYSGTHCLRSSNLFGRARSKHSVCAKFDEVSTNVQNFCYALCIVHS